MSKRRGFTLVELLVVIGIIAVLIAILLPALRRAKEQANRVACMSNMKQLGIAFQLYTGDFKGYFPAPGANPRAEDWIHWQPTRKIEDGAIVKYLGKKFNPAVYRCPSDDVGTHTTAYGPRYEYSYTINFNMTGYDWNNKPIAPRPPVKANNIKQSSTKILMIDESSETIDDGTWAPQHHGTIDFRNVLANRHDKRTEESANRNAGKGNALMADFHAEFIERKLTLEERHYMPRW
jgi:prepilin-type N-terminal cleavage/methylation domain-containing protein/prepilin-type processing-associated H-X9-DG protein